MELVLEKYDFQVKNRFRARGALLFDTDQGPKLLREYEELGNHFMWENEIKERIVQRGSLLVDRVTANREGEVVSQLETGEKFVVYDWYVGDSLDYHSEKQLEQAGENLADLHDNMKNITEEPVALRESLIAGYQRRNRELKRVYHFMRDKRRKSDFELYSLAYFPTFYEKAQNVLKKMQESAYLVTAGAYSADVRHGAYNYHNIIFTRRGIATTDFTSAEYGMQILDLAYFMRKVMEKNNWNGAKGRAILRGYEKKRMLCAQEKEALLLILQYPAKYHKLMSQYMNGKKTWISDKKMEKLLKVWNQEQEKDLFLSDFCTK